jgi:hypothetical protein
VWTDAFHRALRYATVAWVLAGCGLAALAAVLAFIREAAV